MRSMQGNSSAKQCQPPKQWNPQSSGLVDQASPYATAQQVDALQSSVNQLLQAMKDMNPLKSDVSELKKSVQHMSDKFDHFNVEMQQLKKNHADLGSEVNSVKMTSQNLQQENENLKQRITELEQYTRNKNVEIKGVPYQQNENLQSIVSDIAKYLQITMTQNDLAACHRIQSYDKSKETSSIIVQFTTRKMREEWINKKKEISKYKSTIFVKDKPAQVIYINEHLSPTMKQLLHSTLQLKGEIKAQFVWVKEGKIYIRMNQQDKAQRVRNAQDLKNIRQAATNTPSQVV